MKTIFLTSALLVASTGLAISFPIAQHPKEDISKGLIVKIQASGCDAKKTELAQRIQEYKEMEKYLDELSVAGRKNTSGVKRQLENALAEREVLEIEIKKFC